jgi:hypothetical protein
LEEAFMALTQDSVDYRGDTEIGRAATSTGAGR